MLAALLQVEARKWRVYSRKVIKIDPLTPEQMAMKQEQQEMLLRGGDLFMIEEKDRVKNPEPYEVTQTFLAETEREGRAYEEVMNMYLLEMPATVLVGQKGGYLSMPSEKKEYIEARVKRWEEMLIMLKKKVSDGTTVIPMIIKDLQINIEFWKKIKEDPLIVIGNPELQDRPDFLKFNCIAIRRLLELRTTTPLNIRKLINHIELDSEVTNVLETWLHERKDLISKDIVRDRRRKFRILEDKIKQVQDVDNMENVNFLQLRDITNEEYEKEKVPETMPIDNKHFNYLATTSEFLYLKAMTESVILQQTYGFAKDYGQPNFQDFYLLGTEDLDLLAQEHREMLKKEKRRLIDEKLAARKTDPNVEIKKSQAMKEEEFQADEVIEIPLEPMIEDLKEIIATYARAGQCAVITCQWNQLDNILRSVWNLLIYHLSSPLDFERSEIYKDIVMLGEQLIKLLDSFNQTKSEIENSDDQIIDDNFGLKLNTKEKLIPREGQYEKLLTSDMKFYCNFISFTTQCLFVSGKWETMSDLISKFTKVTSLFPPLDPEQSKFYKLYLLQFTVYADEKIYQSANTKSKEKRDALKLRTQQFNIEKQNNWLQASKTKQLKSSLVTGELLPEEIEYRRDKNELEKEIFRLEVFENIIKSEKEANEEALQGIKSQYDITKEQMRNCRKLYSKYALETKALEEEQQKKKNSKLIVAKQKAHVVLTNMVINSYVKCAEAVKARQDTYLLIQ